MKITAARGVRRADVVKQRDEWTKNYEEYRQAEDRRAIKRREARYAVTDPIEQDIAQRLSKFSALRFNVEAKFDEAYSNTYDRSRVFVRVSITCNERETDEDALRWQYSVGLDVDGNVVTQTNSWSGLKATTIEQLRSLRQTVSALEYLSTIDWLEILDKAWPTVEDEPLPEKPENINWTRELDEAALEDIVGDPNTAILIRNWDNSPYWGKNVYIRIVKDSGSQYAVNVIPESYIDIVEQYPNRLKDTLRDVRRIRKSNIHVVHKDGDEPTYWDIPAELLNT